MSTIPESVTLEQFEQYILPYLSTAQRGYVSKTPLCGNFNLVLYRLHTGCGWKRLPVSADAAERERRGEASWQHRASQGQRLSPDHRCSRTMNF